ncbi:autotransporter domain-containing protein [uncultured Campylobacter sp.]|uniref:autotransporter domain-containing protein n=1 Tax=uncultured Campylobacter sp. TaxID=218934 RepID=UPI002629EB9F|nr:autotransporter domain-containing protein [uncultured Campylobacter sp.]
MLKSLKKIVSLALVGAAGFGYASEQNSWSYANAQKSPSNNTSRSDVMSAADSLGAKLSRRDAASDSSASEQYESSFRIKLEYARGFAKKGSYSGRLNNQRVMMPAFRWTGNSGVNAEFWNGITNIGGALVPYVAFGSYKKRPGGDSHSQYLVRRDEDLAQMQRNKAAGIKNLAYTYTGTTGPIGPDGRPTAIGSSRNLSLVYADIDNFVNFYGRENIAGYFIDEVNTEDNPSNIAYMASIYNYIKSKYPEMLVLANNGWGVRDAIAPYADVWMLQEVSADEYINHYRPRTSEFEKDPANSAKILHVIYNASPEQYDEIIRLSRERNAANLFITSDTNAYPSGYDDLPTYFEALMLAINNFTPKNGSLFSQAARSGDRIGIEMPRSKVDLDLTKLARNSAYKNLTDTDGQEFNVNVSAIGNYGGDYKDRSGGVKYDHKSDGILLGASKRVDDLTLGVIFGYQKSDAWYEGKFDGVKENIKSYEFGLAGRYDFNENVDLAVGLTYSTNDHKFETNNGFGAIHGAKYKSQIWDFNTRAGYKFLFENGYIKPYLGLGAIRVDEDAISRLRFSSASKTAPNGTAGIYAIKAFGDLQIFANAEYEHRFSGDSYHASRKYSDRYDVEGLDYSSGVFNGAIGLKYKIFQSIGLSASYELSESKNSLARAAFDVEF